MIIWHETIPIRFCQRRIDIYSYLYIIAQYNLSRQTKNKCGKVFELSNALNMVSELEFNNYDCIYNRARISIKLLTDRGQVFLLPVRMFMWFIIYWLIVIVRCTIYHI